jgi:diguanylate cyclase (GGDEF)-like protein
VPAIDGALVVIARDASGERTAQPRQASEGRHDRLTGLGDRLLFLQQVERALALAPSGGSLTAVMAVDIDQFRKVNDKFGHDAGDGLLVAVARRLQASLRQDDTIARPDATVARLGADQFLVLCENVPAAPAVEAIAERMLEAIRAPLAAGGRVLCVTASAGIALAGRDDEPERLILDAEAALHEAKGLGGARYEFFSAQRHDDAAAATALSNDLDHALERGELHLDYQPKVSLATDRISGVEALLRWDHPGQGPVSPAQFIPAAETTGMIVEIGAWVLGEACRQAAPWQRAFPRASPVNVAVNVSARQFRTGLADTVRAAIADSGIDPAGLCLELTETTVMDDVPTALTILGELKELGLAVSIDDFGTGYSSLAHLRRLPLDEVKIDKSFIDGLGTDPEDTAIVVAVISLAHALDREVVAEGVETVEQLEKLRALGCEFAQGFYLAVPASAADLTDLLTRDAAGQRLPHERSSPATVTSSGTETVLVADDAADVRQLARMSLTAAGFTVAEAVDGATALAAARRLRPDCVVLDVRMPDMTGIEVCRALRSDPRTAACTIVMLTSRADAADKAEAFSAGADDYIVKPFAPRDLVARVRTAVRRRREHSDPA